MRNSLLSASTLAGALIASASLAGPAFAQAQSPAVTPQYNEVEDESTMVQQFEMSVDELEDMDIQGADGENIGEVDEVLTDHQGEIKAVSAEVGGFLGVVEKEVIIELDQLRKEGDRFVTDLTRDQLTELPTWTQ